MSKRDRKSSFKTLTSGKCQEYSAILERIVLSLNRKEVLDVKFAEIFIDINNTLYELLLTGEYKEYPIMMLLSEADKSLSILLNKLEGKANNMDIMDYCISFKFLYYNMIKLFPDGIYANRVLMDDLEAEGWWSTRFEDQVFVPMEKFWIEISKCFPIIYNKDHFLKSVNFTKDDWFSEFVNKDSFNMFMRFYGGWASFANDWCHIYYHPGHMVMSSLEHAKEELLKLKNDLTKYRSPSKSYIICLNWRCDQGFWNIVYIDDNGDIKNNLVKSDQLLNELRKEHLYLYPRGKDPVNAENTTTPFQRDLPNVPNNEEVNSYNNIYNDSTYMTFSETNNVEAYNNIYNDSTYMTFSETNNVEDSTYMTFSETNNVEAKNADENKMPMDSSCFASLPSVPVDDN